MSNRDPRFDPDRRPDAQPRPGRDQQTNMRAHHSLERSPAYYDASHSDAYYPERYLQEALNWNNRDLTQTDNDHPEVQRQFRRQAPVAAEYSRARGQSDTYTENYGNAYDQRPKDVYQGLGPHAGHQGLGPHADQQNRGPGESYRGRGPKGYTRSDDRILEDVCDRLNRDPHVDASEILVTCSDGIVTLEGSIDSRASKRQAEQIVDQCNGVRDVNNRLVISSLNSNGLT